MKKAFLFFGFVFTALIMTSFAFGQESISIDTHGRLEDME